jgi:hypothetical protein
MKEGLLGGTLDVSTEERARAGVAAELGRRRGSRSRRTAGSGSQISGTSTTHNPPTAADPADTEPSDNTTPSWRR